MAIQLSDRFTFIKLLRFTIPTIVMLIFTSIYNVVGGFFVSNYVGKAAFSAVNFIMLFLLMLGAIGFMFGTGGSALIAKTMGEGDTEKPNRIFSLIVYVSVLFGIVIAMLGFIFLRSLTAALGAKNELLENSIKYGRIIKGSISSFLKLEIFHQFRVTPEWGVLKTNKSVRRRGSGCVLLRALGLRKPTLKARLRHIVRVCDANSVVSRANEVLAQSIALFMHTFKTRHST